MRHTVAREGAQGADSAEEATTKKDLEGHPEHEGVYVLSVVRILK